MGRERGVIFQTMCYIAVAMIVATLCLADDCSERLKRQASQPVGLFPFPRVGRSDPELTWENPLFAAANSIEDYDEASRREIIKRQGLVPFPRVGRSGASTQNAKFWAKLYNTDAKRAEASGATSGMWFGPRLGRVQKRETSEKE